METTKSIALKRKVLVDALMLCIDKSQICQQIQSQTIRSILESAISDLWRERQFHLEPVWRMLANQPELGPSVVAPPLLVFKAYEGALGVPVVLPPELEAVPPEDAEIFRSQLNLTPEHFAKSIDEMREIAEMEAAKPTLTEFAATAAEQESAAPVAEAAVAPPSKSKVIIAAVSATLSLGAMGVALWITFFNPPAKFDTSDVDKILALRSALAKDKSIVAVVSDSRWAKTDVQTRRKWVEEILAVQKKKGFESLVLRDENERVVAVANDVGGKAMAAVY